MTSPRVKSILDMIDGGAHPVAVIAETGLSSAYVYTVLRAYRPDRKRAPRTRTSDKVPMIVGLYSRGLAPARIAVLCACSEAYVYRVLAEQKGRV